MEERAPVAVTESGPPRWAWAIATLLFPLGPFLALGFAKILSWPRAIAYGVLSYVPYAVMVLVMMYFDGQDRGFNYPPRIAVILAWLASWIAMGRYQYRLGARVGYWSDSGRRIWRIFGITALAIFAIDALVLALEIVMRIAFPRYWPGA